MYKGENQNNFIYKHNTSIKYDPESVKKHCVLYITSIHTQTSSFPSPYLIQLYLYNLEVKPKYFWCIFLELKSLVHKHIKSLNK